MTLPTAPSKESDTLRNFFLRMTDRIAADPNMDLETMRDMLEREQALAVEPTGITHEEVVAGERPLRAGDGAPP
jgi:hypothetical protein